MNVTEADTQVTVDPVEPAVGAVVSGVDLTRPLPAAHVAALRSALLAHGVIFVRDQDMSNDQFWAFMANFGKPQLEEATGTDEDSAAGIISGDAGVAKFGPAVWHSDTTCLAHPPIATALRSVKLPPVGGDTCWSSMYAAWDALSEPMRGLLDGLTAVHSVRPLLGRLGAYASHYESRFSERHANEQIHPVVITHPETGRKALYVNESFTTRIVELSPAESAAVLAVLFQHVGRPEFVVRWKWRPNDVAFWDNRAVQHCAVADYTAPRVMQRLVLPGLRPEQPTRLLGGEAGAR